MIPEQARNESGTHLVVNQCSQWQVVEQVCKVLPDIRVAVLSQALVVEAVHLCNLSRLVVASQDGNSIAIPDLERDEQRHCLDGVVPTVYVVSHEEVVCVGRVAADAEEFREVMLVVTRVKD